MWKLKSTLKNLTFSVYVRAPSVLILCDGILGSPVPKVFVAIIRNSYSIHGIRSITVADSIFPSISDGSKKKKEIALKTSILTIRSVNNVVDFGKTTTILQPHIANWRKRCCVLGIPHFTGVLTAVTGNLETMTLSWINPYRLVSFNWVWTSKRSTYSYEVSLLITYCSCRSSFYLQTNAMRNLECRNSKIKIHAIDKG